MAGRLARLSVVRPKTTVCLAHRRVGGPAGRQSRPMAARPLWRPLCLPPLALTCIDGQQGRAGEWYCQALLRPRTDSAGPAVTILAPRREPLAGTTMHTLPGPP